MQRDIRLVLGLCLLLFVWGLWGWLRGPARPYAVDIRAFGARPGARFENTAIIQKALDSGAKTVFMPDAAWHISGRLAIPRGVTLSGDPKAGRYPEDAPQLQQQEVGHTETQGPSHEGAIILCDEKDPQL